jgi:fumarate hydratase class II
MSNLQRTRYIGGMKPGTRVEWDTMGEMEVPAGAYYGPQTARAVENFPISGLRFPRPFIRALGLIKAHGAKVNHALGSLPENLSNAIARAAREVAEGKWDSEFVVDIFQTGSGTSTNMNANEVIARRAEELLDGKTRVHPNDHVNRGQSSNDVIPSALHIAAAEESARKLRPALARLEEELRKKAQAWRAVHKIGRTHLQDATPLTLGEEFSGFATQMTRAQERLADAEKRILELPLGGTAVGTGINTHPEFARRVIAEIANEIGLAFREAENHFEAQGARDAAVELSGALKTIAVSLIKIANDIRLLGSGPRLGFGELKLPATQPGSSIMPGKVNPVMCEMLIQVGCQVIGNDAAITFAGATGQLQLNAMIPVIAYNLLQSIEILANGADVFARRCVAGLEPNTERLERNIEQTLALVTALVPEIGYDAAAAIAKEAEKTGWTVREVASEKSGLDAATLERLLKV